MKALFTSRQFWFALLMFLAVIVASFIPGFEINTEEAAAYCVVVASYILGVSIDPGPGGWRGWMQSRKFWAAVIGFLVTTLSAFNVQLPFGITADQLVALAVTIGAYIAGTAIQGPPPDAEPPTTPYPYTEPK